MSVCSGFGSVFLSKTLDKERVAIKRMPHVTDKQKWINVDEVYFLKNSVDCNNIVGYNAAYLMRDEIWVCGGDRTGAFVRSCSSL